MIEMFENMMEIKDIVKCCFLVKLKIYLSLFLG